jgi:hypothetical protein
MAMPQSVDPHEAPTTLPPAYTGYAHPQPVAGTPVVPVTVTPVTTVQVEVNKSEPQVVICPTNQKGDDFSVAWCLGCLCGACLMCTVM